MTRAAKVLGGLLFGVCGAAGAAPQEPPVAPPPAIAPAAMPVRVNLLDIVKPEFREAVSKVVRQPTVSTRGSGEEVVCTVSVYEWLYDHPDRVALAWQRLKVPSVTITDLGGGKFGWTDENGSDVSWQTVGTFTDGRVWYATGKVKPAPGIPTIPVQVVVVVSHPRRAEKDGVAVFAPTAQAFLHSDSRAANVALRLLGPQTPKLAEQTVEQLLEFFGGIAAHVQKNPSKADTLLAPAKK